MAIITRFEETKDIKKVVMQTITQQDVAGPISKNGNARSYREEQVDGVWTLTEEILIDQGAGVWSSDGAVSSEPLETHVYFHDIANKVKNLWTVWKRNPAAPELSLPQNKISGSPWTPEAETDSKFITFYSYIKRGVETWLAPRLTARFTELEDGPPDTGNIGMIDNKPVNVFGYYEGYWILSGCRSQQEGEKWRNTYEYLGAGPSSSASNNGWEPTLYGGGGGAQ